MINGITKAEYIIDTRVWLEMMRWYRLVVLFGARPRTPENQALFAAAVIEHERWCNELGRMQAFFGMEMQLW